MKTKTGRKYWVGFDLGGTKMYAAVFDRRMRMIESGRKRTRPDESAASGMSRIIGLIHDTLDAANIKPSALCGIGVGTPGPLDLERGVLLFAPNLGWKNVPLRQRLQKEFRCPVSVINDVDAGAFGEYAAGAAQGARSVVGIFPGTGIGGALIYEGKLVRGARRSCMEIGHMKVVQNGRACGCGGHGCLEAHASRLAISADAAMAVFRGEAPALARVAGTDLSKIRSGMLAQAIAAGDGAVEAIVRRAASLIGLAAANVINLVAPDLVVLGGGLVEAMPKLFLGEVRAAADANVMDAFRRTYRVIAATLGDRASVTGAAAFAAQAGVQRQRR